MTRRRIACNSLLLFVTATQLSFKAGPKMSVVRGFTDDLLYQDRTTYDPVRLGPGQVVLCSRTHDYARDRRGADRGAVDVSDEFKKVDGDSELDQELVDRIDFLLPNQTRPHRIQKPFWIASGTVPSLPLLCAPTIAGAPPDLLVGPIECVTLQRADLTWTEPECFERGYARVRDGAFRAVIHTHPRGSSLSHNDLLMLSRLDSVTAVTKTTTYKARRGPRFGDLEREYTRLSIRATVFAVPCSRRPTPHEINLALARAGVIVYDVATRNSRTGVAADIKNRATCASLLVLGTCRSTATPDTNHARRGTCA